jgi:hypothetical protein
VHLYLADTRPLRFAQGQGDALPAQHLSGTDLRRMSPTPVYDPYVPSGFLAWTDPASDQAEHAPDGSGLDVVSRTLPRADAPNVYDVVTLVARPVPAGFDPARTCPPPNDWGIPFTCQVLGRTRAGALVRVAVDQSRDGATYPVTTYPIHGAPFAVIGTTLVELQHASLSSALGVPALGNVPFTPADTLKIFDSLDPHATGPADRPFTG